MCVCLSEECCGVVLQHNVTDQFIVHGPMFCVSISTSERHEFSVSMVLVVLQITLYAALLTLHPNILVLKREALRTLIRPGCGRYLEEGDV